MAEVYVYITDRINDDSSFVLPSYIGNISNPRVMAEKRSAYSLLKRAVMEVYGIRLDTAELYKSESNKPYHPKFRFSLSHSHGICAVAISSVNVGVDVERRIDSTRAEKILNYITHPHDAKEDVTKLWTCKEAVFKLLDQKAFMPCQIHIAPYYTESRVLCFSDTEFTVSVALEERERVIFKIC